MATAGFRLLAAYLDQENIPEKQKKLSLLGADFFVGDELGVHSYVINHVNLHGVKPTAAIVQDKTGVLLPPGEGEQLGHYHTEVVKRFQRRTLTSGILAVESIVKTDSVDPAEAITIMQGYLSKAARSLQHVTAVSEELPHYLEYLHKLKIGAIPLMASPYQTFNQYSHGIHAGDLLSLVAPSGHGKSTTCMFLADWFYNQFGAHSLFVSAEMSVHECMSRLIALRTKTPASILTSGLIPTHIEKQIVEEFAPLDDYITLVDSQLSSTVEEVSVITQQVKPDVLIVDGAYLLGLQDTSFKGWERIKEVAECLKRDVAMAQGIPVVASWQLNTEGSKLAKKGQVAGTEAIGGSVAISQVSSIVIEQAITDHITEEGDEMEVLRMTNTKNRNGKPGATWLTDFNYDAMEFGEISGVTTPVLPPPSKGKKNG